MRKLIRLFLFLVLTIGLIPVLSAQPLNPLARTVNNGASDPAVCNPTAINIFLNRTIPAFKICTAANAWAALVASGGAGGWPLKATDGTATAPSYTFNSETTLGLFRGGAKNLGVAGAAADTSFSINTAFGSGAVQTNSRALTVTSIDTAARVTSEIHSLNTSSANISFGVLNINREDATVGHGHALTFSGGDSGSAANNVLYGAIGPVIIANTAAAQTGDMVISSMAAGTMAERFRVKSTGLIVPSSSTAGIQGTVTNDSANAGSIGEVISSVIATGSSITLTTNTTANVTSVSLTAGDWDCTGAVDFTFGATTSYTNLIGSISTVSATIGGQDSKFDFETPAAVPTAAADATFPLPIVRQQLSGTTTVFLVAQGTFTVSTLKAYGTIRCRRMR